MIFRAELGLVMCGDIKTYDKKYLELMTKQKLPKAMGVFVVKNDRGLHTRPSTEIVKCVSVFQSDVKLVFQKTEVNAKSLLGILMLAAGKGSKIKVFAFGEDAQEAVNCLIDLADHQFNIHY